MENNIQQESPCGLFWLVHVIEARNTPILESYLKPIATYM
jgi:hypothetical protein